MNMYFILHIPEADTDQRKMDIMKAEFKIHHGPKENPFERYKET